MFSEGFGGPQLSCKRFRVIKPEIRALGVDDGFFVPHSRGYALIAGVVFRGGYWLDGVMHTRVEVDGLDATDKIASMITNSPHNKQLRIIMLSGVTFAGFNVVDIRNLSLKTGLPVIAVVREKPDFPEIYNALRNLPNSEERWEAIKGAGKPFMVNTRSRRARVYVQACGVFEDDARKIVKVTSTRSDIPEPLRVAHLIASGISTEAV
jgi:endonuclease V-like protein UPF0215 family